MLLLPTSRQRQQLLIRRQRERTKLFSETMMENRSRKKNVLYLTGIIVVITIVVVVSLVSTSNASKNNQSSSEEFQTQGDTIAPSSWNNNDNNEELTTLGNANRVASQSALNVIVEGTSGGIPYLRCTPSSSKKTELVLLHGASFTKEIWRSKDLMKKICKTFSVMALDLPVSAGRTELKKVLDSMKSDGLCTLPISIVTPSASGRSIIDWLNDMQVMKKYIRKWVPVASPAIALGDKTQLQQLGNWLPILAIHGSRDKAGKRLSNILGDWSKANVTQIPGGHPCYLDSPGLFVQLLKEFLSK